MVCVRPRHCTRDIACAHVWHSLCAFVRACVRVLKCHSGHTFHAPNLQSEGLAKFLQEIGEMREISASKCADFRPAISRGKCRG